MRVFVDMDGVVANFIEPALKWHGVENPYNDPTFRGDEAWDIVKKLRIDPDTFWKGFNYSFWRSLPKTKEADGIIEVVRGFTDDVCFLSAPCGTPGCLEGKNAWVKDHYPDIPLILTAAAKGSYPPKYMCASDGTVLIDDHTKNIERWIAWGGVGVLVPRPWNYLYRHESPGNITDDIRRLLVSAMHLDLYRCIPETGNGVPAT